jgi:hypothetical protein
MGTRVSPWTKAAVDAGIDPDAPLVVAPKPAMDRSDIADPWGIGGGNSGGMGNGQGFDQGGGGGGMGSGYQGPGGGGGGGGFAGQEELRMEFEQHYEGKIIGRQGAVVNELQERYGCKVRVMRGEAGPTLISLHSSRHLYGPRP